MVELEPRACGPGEAFAEAAAAGLAIDHRVIGGTTHGFLDKPASDGFARGVAAIHDWLTAAAGFSAR